MCLSRILQKNTVEYMSITNRSLLGCFTQQGASSQHSKVLEGRDVQKICSSLSSLVSSELCPHWGLDPSEGLSHLCPHALESAHSHNQLLL